MWPRAGLGGPGLAVDRHQQARLTFKGEWKRRKGEMMAETTFYKNFTIKDDIKVGKKVKRKTF